MDIKFRIKSPTFFGAEAELEGRGIPLLARRYNLRERMALQNAVIPILAGAAMQAVREGQLEQACDALITLADELPQREKVEATVIVGTRRNIARSYKHGEVSEQQYLESTDTTVNLIASFLERILEDRLKAARTNSPPATSAEVQGSQDIDSRSFQFSRDTMIGCRDLGLHPKRHRPILRSISLDVKRGQLIGLIGQNGSGKTSLLLVLAGLVSPTIGQLRYPILETMTGSRLEMLSAIEFVPHHPTRITGTIRRNLELRAAIIGLPRDLIDAEVQYVVERLDLGRYLDYDWSRISDGYKSRLALALALLSQPAVLLLDEPMAPLDPGMKRFYAETLAELARSSRQTTIVVASNEMESVRPLVDELWTMDQGQLRKASGLEGAAGVPNKVYQLEGRVTDSFVSRWTSYPGSIGMRRLSAESLEIRAKVDVSSADVLKMLLETGSKIERFQDVSNDGGTIRSPDGGDG